jgi:peroxiredoxin
MTTPNPIDEGIADRFAQHKARIAGMSFPNALAAGDRAPDFELENAAGQRVRLTDLLTRGPVVLTFYRGAWCPYCNAQLRGLQQALPELEALGASLVAVSPQLPDGSAELIDEAALTFEVLSDLDSTVASAYGITFTLAPSDQALFLEVGNDLRRVNGNDTWVLPAPSTFVIATDATIHHAHVDADFTQRPEPTEIVRVLRTLAVKEV